MDGLLCSRRVGNIEILTVGTVVIERGGYCAVGQELKVESVEVHFDFPRGPGDV